MLVQREYTRRHNDVYILENEHYLLYWDKAIQTDHLVVHNRPDIVLRDRHTQLVKIIEIAVTIDKNIQLTYTIKIQEYDHLKHEIIEMWRVKSTIVHPIVISASGNVYVRCVSQLKDLGVNRIPESGII